MQVDKGVELFRSLIPKPNEVVFIVGAGVSVTAGFPLWGGASEAGFNAAVKNGLPEGASAHARELLAAKNYYHLFSILKMALPAATYRKVVMEAFDRPHEASETQKLLASAPARGIITTNFDECLTAAVVHVRNQAPLKHPANNR